MDEEGKKLRVLVAGGTGLIGSALMDEGAKLGHEVISISRREVDLIDSEATFDVISELKPDTIIDAAARVGGIGANNAQPVEFLLENLSIQNNLMTAAFEVGVDRFVFLGSSCIYPRDCPQPIREESLLTGKLEETNSAYAIAKIAGIELIRSYRKQHGKAWISLMPTNLYGPNDNFAINASHVLPALVRKFVDAQRFQKPFVELWGDGSPLREFLHVQDCARAILLAAKVYDGESHLNIGSTEEITIKDLATMISQVSGFDGEIKWNAKMPNGTPRKVLDSTRIRSLGWSPRISLKEGIQSTIDWYRSAVEQGVARL